MPLAVHVYSSTVQRYEHTGAPPCRVARACRLTIRPAVAGHAQGRIKRVGNGAYFVNTCFVYVKGRRFVSGGHLNALELNDIDTGDKTLVTS